MDPERTLSELLEIAHELLDLDDEECCGAHRLAELIVSLDSWLNRGGVKPSRWETSS
jgi:hypothetical protein